MTLHEFNTLPKDELKAALTSCCASGEWVQRMLHFVPVEDLVELLEDAEEQWWNCSESDWKEAFEAHPEIGDVESLKQKYASTAHWAAGEQSGVSGADDHVLQALAAANKKYKDRFGYIFIVCATGKSAAEMLGLLESRLLNDPAAEIKIAADEQNRITKLRLEKLLA